MIRALRLGATVWALTAGLGASALAEAPDQSLRPVPRPGISSSDSAAPLQLASAGAFAPARTMRPPARPWSGEVAGGSGSRTVPAASTQTVAGAAKPASDPITTFFDDLASSLAGSAATTAPTTMAAATGTRLAVVRAPRPAPRPGNIATLVANARSAPRSSGAQAGPGGSICGVNAIKGDVIRDIPGPGACGVSGAVRVSSVQGIPLSMKPTIDCTTAKAINAWVRDGVIPAVGRTGGGLARLNVIAHYSCRSRNNQKGAKLSEHAKGHAVDISGVTLADGTTLTVLKHWSSGSYGKVIKAMHRSACGPFGTVLGPNADRYHQDHLHVDTARYRGGPYCK